DRRVLSSTDGDGERRGPRRAFGPGKERVNVRQSSIACELAVRGQLLAPIVHRRQFVYRGLSRQHDVTIGWAEQPVGERPASSGRRSGPEPLEERRTSKEIEIDGVGVMRKVDRRRYFCRRQVVPAALDTSGGTKTDC